MFVSLSAFSEKVGEKNGFRARYTTGLNVSELPPIVFLRSMFDIRGSQADREGERRDRDRDLERSSSAGLE